MDLIHHEPKQEEELVKFKSFLGEEMYGDKINAYSETKSPESPKLSLQDRLNLLKSEISQITKPNYKRSIHLQKVPNSNSTPLRSSPDKKSSIHSFLNPEPFPIKKNSTRSPEFTHELLQRSKESLLSLKPPTSPYNPSQKQSSSPEDRSHVSESPEQELKSKPPTTFSKYTAIKQKLELQLDSPSKPKPKPSPSPSPSAQAQTWSPQRQEIEVYSNPNPVDVEREFSSPRERIAYKMQTLGLLPLPSSQIHGQSVNSLYSNMDEGSHCKERRSPDLKIMNFDKQKFIENTTQQLQQTQKAFHPVQNMENAKKANMGHKIEEYVVNEGKLRKTHEIHEIQERQHGLSQTLMRSSVNENMESMENGERNEGKGWREVLDENMTKLKNKRNQLFTQSEQTQFQSTASANSPSRLNKYAGLKFYQIAEHKLPAPRIIEIIQLLQTISDEEFEFLPSKYVQELLNLRDAISNKVQSSNIHNLLSHYQF